MEINDVKQQYSIIASSFSKTRYKKWQCIDNFLQNIQPNETILELGCGNGKNIINYKLQSTGVDICPELCAICKNQGINVIESNILDFNSDILYDYILCVAVIHHFSKLEDKNKLLDKIKSLLKPSGKAIITCWLTTEPRYNLTHGDNFIKFGQINRYYYIFEPNELYNLCKNKFNIVNNYDEEFNDIVIVSK